MCFFPACAVWFYGLNIQAVKQLSLFVFSSKFLCSWSGWNGLQSSKTLLQMLPPIIPPQWCSIHVGEVAFGFIFKGCFRILLDFTHPKIDLYFCFCVLHWHIFTGGLTQTGSSKINHHSPTQSCWNVSSLNLACSYFPMQQLLTVTPSPQTPVSPRNQNNGSTLWRIIPLWNPETPPPCQLVICSVCIICLWFLYTVYSLQYKGIYMSIILQLVN